MVTRTETPAPTPRKPAVGNRYEEFLGQLSVKGRASITRHDETCDADADPRHGEMWKRLAGGLGRLAPHATEVTGQNAVKFYVPDGKYRLQVFALEDTRQGTIALYFPDILKLAITRKIIASSNTTHQHTVPGGTGVLELTPIDSETRDLTVCKAMVGWGRRVVRVEIGAGTSEEHVQAVEKMCELAAQNWATTPPA